MPVTTPKKIDAIVLKFCTEISNEKPSFVSVDAEDTAIFDNCFFNVEDKIEREGGHIIYGWIIWIWERVYIEAEHHVIWETADGKWIDISPKRQNEKQIVFVPDRERVFDKERYNRTDNIRKNLSGSKIVYDFFACASEKFRFMQENSDGEIVTLNKHEFEQFQRKFDMAQRGLFLKYLKPNDPCPCGSRKKNKKCHRIALN